MAEALLKSWNAPAIVTDVEIDAARKEPIRQGNTHISDLHAGKGISWTQTDEALPMPIDMRDPLVALAVRSSDFVEALNQQPLKVRGLAAGRYTLKIDGEPAGTFTAEQLAAGINLATSRRPWRARRPRSTRSPCATTISTPAGARSRSPWKRTTHRTC